MKKPTTLKNVLIVLLILFSVQLFAQNQVPFTPRFDDDLKGDIVLIGNNILGPNNNDFNVNWRANAQVNMRYIDIDSDGSTFSSSSADLVIPINPNIPPAANSCYEIVHAGLYWSAVTSGTQPINNVKLSGPSGGYIDIVADNIIFNAGGTSVDGGDSFPYACYADVTNTIRALGTDQGTYTVANVSSAQGQTDTFDPTNRTGYSAGWSLFIVYQNPSLPGKSITSFDGFSTITEANNPIVDIPIVGFRTVPAPAPVRANFAFAALEGDSPYVGDRLRINGTRLSDATRDRDNFFNSSITGPPVRVPNSSNTLGFDTGILAVPNPGNGVINNNDTSAVIRLESNQDTYFPYFFAFAVDIIAPNIVLTKTVEDALGNNIGGQLIGLGEELNYVIGFENTGNDDATGFTIRDILPNNIEFNYPADMGLLPPGVSVQSYNPATREIIFSINDSVIEEHDPVLEIRFKVTVVRECSLLNNACDNIVSNQAYSTYGGTLNPSFVISDDPSFSTNTGCLLTPAATNFLADISCTFEEDVILCGDNVVLTAGSGYDSYSWSTSPSGTPVIGTTQAITVTTPGTYYVRNTATAPCQSIDQIFNVITYGAGVTNPIIPFADQVVVCPNDGKDLPNIFMCGANDTRFIDTNITDASSIIWQRLDEASCSAVPDNRCANEDASCTWNQVQTGPSYLVDTAGQYSLRINYTGGCFNLFYFNVYENVLVPTVTSNDIICTTPGEIVVGDVPSGYEYSIDNVNFQPSNIFPIAIAGIYTVYIRQIGVTPNPCIFTVPDIQIRERNFTVTTTITNPLCNNGQGSVIIAANDVRPQYYYSIYDGATLINSVGPIVASDYTFPNLNTGTYTINVSTDDGCAYTGDITIINPPALNVTAALTSPLTCTDGEITVYPVGGTAPYFYFVNSPTDFQTVPVISVSNPGGVYNIRVVDSNNCSTTTSITVDPILPPVFTVDKTDVLCYNDTNGQIVFNVTNANGYTISYSIDNGVTYVANPTFSNLNGGTYQTMIRYSLSGTDCFSTAQDIIITQPDEALTASSGVSELAGCGPSGEGRLRITNPQGGTPFPGPNFYEYSFDNQATWITTNNAYVFPGTYTLYIRDANGCIYPMPGIVLDPEPVPPTINIDGNPDFNCDGTATSTVVVNNTGGLSYEYTYLLDGVVNPNTTNPEVFLNVPSGPHEITVQYRLLTVPTFSNLLNEDFGYGEDTTSPGINTTYYCFERQVPGTECKGHISITDGDYSVTSNIVHLFSGWFSPTDHTPATSPPTPDGRYLVVNIGATIPKTAVLYEKTISDIIPNQPINVEFFAMNIVGPSVPIADPDLTVALVDASGVEISSFSTGSIPKSQQWENYPKTPMTLDPGANTTLRFIIRSNVQETNGNDVAIDDIRVFQIPITCITEAVFPFVIDSNNAFTSQITNATHVTCLNANDGTITIAAQNFDATNGFQYSIDNGTTWNTQLTSPYTITGLAAGNYDILIRYEDAVPTCTDTFTQEITTPVLLEVSAIATPVTCLVGSTITATATGGTLAYSYELLDAVTLNLVSNFPGSGILNNIPPGDYIIRVTDANNCQADTGTILSISAPSNPTATIDVTSDLCYDPTNAATLVVTASGGQIPYEYNINGGPFGSSNTFANLTPGSYTIIVRDAYGCTFPLPAQTIAPQLTVSTVLTKDLDCSVSPDALITGTILGGTPPYTYEISINSGAYAPAGATGTPFTYLTATAGDYRFRIIDALGCTAESNVITINAIVNPTATVTTVNPTCFGDADGSVQIIPAGGVGPYTYSFNGSPFSTQSFYSGLSAGTAYSYEVRDSKECPFTGTVTLTEPSILAATAVVAPPLSCSPANTNQPATVTVTATVGTGTGPYEYSFNGSGYSATNTLSVNDNGADQTINYSVRDAQGCTLSGSIVVTALNPPTDLAFSSTPVTCTITTSDVTLTATGGVGSLTYAILSPAASTGNVTGLNTGIFTGLAPDTYLFEVTDANGCYYTELYTVDPVINITVLGLLVNDVSCNGGSDGAVDFTVTNFTGTYSYTVNAGAPVVGQSAATINLTGLPVGNQIIVVTDETTGCTATNTIIVTEPANVITFTATSTNVFCTNDNSQITITAAGGTPNYTYAAVIAGNPAPANPAYAGSSIVTVDTNSATDLAWDVYVKDANDCIEMNTVTIVSNPLPTVTTPPLTSNQCTVTSGFTFTATGTGIAPLAYSIDGGVSYQASPIFTVNAPGTYTVTIRDGNGCTATSATATDVFTPLVASAALTKDLTCSLPAEALMDITVSGGNGPYSYRVSIGGAPYAGPQIPIVGALFTYTPVALTGNTYQFEITDANTCTVVTNVITTNTPVNPVITSVVETQAILCFGESTAAIDITIDNTQGLAPFTINVNNDTTATNYGTQTSGLPAGNYTITVTDANGCTDTDTIVISEPLDINTSFHADPITCFGGGVSSGAIFVDGVTGGTAPYNYYVTGTNGYSNSELNATGTASVSFNVVDFGLYQILVVDANGCSQLIQDVLVASPPTDLDITVSSPPTLCATGGTSIVTIGGTLTGNGPYHFAIYTGPGMTYSAPTVAPWQDEDAFGSETSTFTGLLPGVTYTFIIYDELTQCYYYETSTVPVPTNSTLTTNAVVENNITCTGSADGNVSFDITSIYPVATDVTYEIFNSLSLTTTGITGSGTVPANGTLSVPNLGLLPVGTYFVFVEEAAGATNAGCSVITSTFSITESAALLTISAAVSKNANCNDLGIITATAQHGTGSYEYQAVVTGNPIVPVNWASANTFSLAGSITYDVYVRDAFGCIQFDTVVLPTDALPTINPVAQQCFVNTPFNITLTGTTFTATATYSIGGPFQASPNFVINAPGTYTLSIQDENGCIATTSFDVEPQLFLNANLTKDLDCTVTPDGSITLTPSGGTGTYTTFEVNYNSGGFAVIAGSPYTVTIDGTYVFRVTDSQGCQAISNIITVNPLSTPTLTEVPTDVSCNGGSDGSIVVTAANGIPPYQYSIDNGATFQASNVFNGLAPGPYNVVVRDAKSCDSAATLVTIGEPLIVTGTAVLTQALACGVSNTTQAAIVTVTGGGGTAPYTYSFDGGLNYTATNTFTTNVSGIVSALVRDSNGCISAAVIENVPALDPPTDLTFVSTPVTCLAMTSTVTLTATNGIASLAYTILSPASATGNVTGVVSGIFTGLTPDTYLFEVTDANGCTYQESYTVDPVTNITVSGVLVNNVNCNGGLDGAISFAVADFAGTYSYSITGGALPATGAAQSAATINFPGLGAGTYTITITDDSTGCTDNATVIVDEPANPLAFTAIATNVFCTNFNSQITVTATNGTGPYTYAVVMQGAAAPLPVAYGNSNVLTVDTNLGTDLDWDVYVIDANNCTLVTPFTVTIINDPLPTITVPAMASCLAGADPFTFSVLTSSGVGTLEYSIGTGFQLSGTFTVSTAGTYTITVRDANGCEETSTPITVYEPLDLTPTITALPTCLDNDGVITVTPIGGSGPGNYNYTISPSPVSISIAGNVISGVPSGTYTVTITDLVTTCTNTAPVTLSAATPVIFTTSAVDVSCNGGNDGSITVNLPASNDNPVYTYELIAPSTMLRAAQNSNVFTGLIVGSYTVRVTSGRGCFDIATETIGEPIVITPSVTAVQYACNAGVNTPNFASITVNSATGGSGTYINYEFIRGGTVEQFGANNEFIESDLLGGTYTINVYDDNGCVGTTTETILPFINLDTVNVVIDNGITCTNDEDITVSVVSSGGIPANLEYTVEDVVGATLGGIYSQTNNTGVFTGLPIGNYFVTVTNLDTNCSLQTAHYVVDPNTFDLTIDAVVDVTCFTDTDGSINVTFIDRSPLPTDESGAFDYSIVDALGNPVSTGSVPNAGPVTLSNFSAGTYTITANLINTPFCTVSKNFTITAPTEALSIQETHTEITCVSGNNDGTISATAVGGWSGPYEFQLEEAVSGVISAYSNVSDFSGLVAGDYTVSVRDSRGCIAFVNVILVIPAPIIVTATASTNLLTCFNDDNATITASASGGQGSNYSYTLNMMAPTVTSSGPQASPVFTNLGAGTYTVTVTDGYNCSGTSANIVINQPTQIQATLVTTTTQTCLTSATLTLSATGGTGPYTYSDTQNFVTTIGSFASSTTFPVGIGTHVYYVRDANGCDANISNEITIDPLPTLTADIVFTNINCAGDNTGSITATAQGGLGNYVYTLQDSSGTDMPSAIQNSPGVFTELVARIYQVRVDSGDCLYTTPTITITEPANPLIATFVPTEVTCPGANDGILQINASGGTGLIRYAISPRLDQFFETSIFEDLAPGTYQAIAQDELGCFIFESFTITAPVPVVLSIVPNSLIPEICEGDLDGAFSVDITGGNLPYSVVLDDINGVYITGTPLQTVFDFPNLGGGDHIVFVRDALGCMSEWNIAFPASVRINPEASIEYGCTGNLSTNTVTVTIDASITTPADVDYSLDGGPYQASNVFVNVPPGLGHYIDARHTNGCTQRTESFDISQFDPLTLVLEDGGLNEIVAVTDGGAEPYEYTLNDESYGTTSTFIIYASGDYTVTVTDSNGCVATATRYFEYIDVCISNYFTPNGDNDLDEWGPGCTSQYKDLTFDIFDRYGREIATLRVGDKWDGKYNGAELPTGDYWYVLKLNDPKDDREFVGHFTLYR